MFKYLKSFFSKKSNSISTEAIIDHPIPTEKININDFDMIYQEILDSFNSKKFKKFLFTYQSITTKNIEGLEFYSKNFELLIHSYLKIILEKKVIKDYLYLSRLYFNEEDITIKIWNSLIKTYYEGILEFNNRLNFFNFKSRITENYNTFENTNTYSYYITDLILNNITIHSIHSHYIDFIIVNYKKCLIDYYKKFTIKIREKVENNTANKNEMLNDISNEIIRVKFLYKKHKNLKYLKKYVNELNELYNDLSLITENDDTQKKIDNNAIKYNKNDLKEFIANLKDLTYIKPIKETHQNTTNNNSLICDNELNTFTSQQKKSLKELLMSFLQNSEDDVDDFTDILLNHKFKKSKNPKYIIKSDVKTFCFLIIFLEKGNYITKNKYYNLVKSNLIQTNNDNNTNLFYYKKAKSYKGQFKLELKNKKMFELKKPNKYRDDLRLFIEKVNINLLNPNY